MSEQRIVGIFAKDDPWFQFDPDIIKVGPMAELLHHRAIEYTKRRLSDAVVPKYALGEVAQRIPAVRKHMSSLVASGLWIDEGDYWRLRNWEKWQMAKEEREARSEAKAKSGKKGMHSRWHTSPEKALPDCPQCVELGWADA